MKKAPAGAGSQDGVMAGREDAVEAIYHIWMQNIFFEIVLSPEPERIKVKNHKVPVSREAICGYKILGYLMVGYSPLCREALWC